MSAASKRLWPAVLLPPVFWALQLSFGWFVEAHACPGTSRPWSVGAARVAVGIVTVLSLAVSVWGLLVVFRYWKGRGADDVERARYLSMAGLVVGVALTLGILFAGLPSVILRGCGEVR
jgi:hypothetical protein